MCVCGMGGGMRGGWGGGGFGGASVHAYLHACLPKSGCMGRGHTHACIHVCNRFACVHTCECDASKQVPLALTRWGDINK